MNISSGTTHAKPNGHRKPANGLARDREALSKAAALMAETPAMRPATALKRTGVTSPAKVKRLSKALAEEKAALVERHEIKKASAARLKSAETARGRSSIAALKAARPARKPARDIPPRDVSRSEPKAEPAVPKDNLHASREDVVSGHAATDLQQAHSRFPELAAKARELSQSTVNGASAVADVLDGSRSTDPLRFWSAMLRWSPYGIMLRQTALVAQIFAGNPRQDNERGASHE